MSVDDILREKQPNIHKKLTKIRKKKVENLTEKDIKELMHHSSYKRSSRGAMKQVR